MTKTNLAATRIKPEAAELMTLHVLRRTRLSPHFMRVTLGRGDIGRFEYMGFDQWFRLFIPVAEDSGLARLPKRLNMLAYARYLTLAKATRPVLRNYSVRAYRESGPEGPELDVDFVLHGDAAAGTAGPAASWALACEPGDVVALLDEGIGFNPLPGRTAVRLVGDETALPAIAGILASLPAQATGHALIEVPEEADQQRLAHPRGVRVHWLPRADLGDRPGALALAAARDLPSAVEPFYGWVAGEQSLAVELRRSWVAAGVARSDLMFCGYWRAPRGER
ncbi:siderophore-interacting protein [Mycetocola spongiae]|uniref:siderophore-interacting protein n=1 Tax=Mycetocola spongiae TaxID=2859226 RepID=UPI001CF4D61F|nr:siderophore-interacting protein [Mycetocola spongiae]UCR88287.1 siderophore-interacting protein [Mycetocola spongiae]